MDISVISSWLGIVVSMATGVASIWKLYGWLQRQVAIAREGSELGADLVEALLSQATNPARRADIHAYIQFRCTEIKSDRNLKTLQCLAMGFGLGFVSFYLVVALRFLDFYAMQWLWWLTFALILCLLVSFVMMLFFQAQVWRYDRAWHKKAGVVLQQRAFIHAVKN